MPYNPIKSRTDRERTDPPSRRYNAEKAARDKLEYERIMEDETPLQLEYPLKRQRTVGSQFGTRSDPFTGEKKFHSGHDFGAREGTPIYASEDGWIDENTPDPVGGYKVTVKHKGGYQTRYLHMSRLSPKGLRGGQVRKGDVLGYVGSTGRSTGPHLHYGVRKDNRAVDPTTYYKKDPKMKKGLGFAGSDPLDEMMSPTSQMPRQPGGSMMDHLNEEDQYFSGFEEDGESPEWNSWKQEVEMDRQNRIRTIKQSRKSYDAWDMQWRRKGVEAGFDQQEIDAFMDSLWEMDDGELDQKMDTSDY
jgi:hypothetical protein